jgi:copper chaperone
MNLNFNVQGMTCSHCERSVTQALQSVDPQATVSIDRANGQVQVQSEAPRDALAQAIAQEGYTVVA